MLEDDESTQTLQPNILQLDELLTTDADDELFGASDYLPATLQFEPIMFNWTYVYGLSNPQKGKANT
ncbi:hypothetical protein MTR_0126s0070 [Medicago truncatula]|uniref:Uncharacterized protein n=1 Tax=Medicago truncatula TaxID=3880 RepID=A0A072TSW0_MEDTR|nr:hypothetical protein MTR_0126s0070 [Medicago truncatula]